LIDYSENNGSGLPDKLKDGSSKKIEHYSDVNGKPSLNGSSADKNAGESIEKIIKRVNGKDKSYQPELEFNNSRNNYQLNGNASSELNGSATNNHTNSHLPKFSKQLSPEDRSIPVSTDPCFNFSIDVPKNTIVTVRNILGIETGVLLDDYLAPGSYIIRVNKKEFWGGTAYYQLYVEVPWDTETDYKVFPNKPGKKYRLIEVREVQVTL